MDKDYYILESNIIKNNQTNFINDCKLIYNHLSKDPTINDLTWDYKKYNIFSVTSPSLIWYKLFEELKQIIRDFTNTNEPLWMQSWLNFHTVDTLLPKHNHKWETHGYICINPSYTYTVFDEYKIKNKPGLIYIGPGNRLHSVECYKSFKENRITLGFDVTNKAKNINNNMSLMPI